MHHQHRFAARRPALRATARAAMATLGLALVLPLAGCFLDATPGAGTDATGGGGNTGGGGSGTDTTVSGFVVKGPVVGSTITAYQLKDDGSLGDALGSGATGADGSYRITLRTTWTGPVAIVAAGGTYVSETDGSTVTKTSDLLAVIPSLAGGSTSDVAVTPLTDMVAARARLLMGGGRGITDALGDAYSLVGKTYGVPADKIATMVPKFDKPSLGTSEFTSGVVLGALDACDKLLPAGARGSLFRAISDDLSDGVFDGKKNGVPIPIPGGSLLSRTAGTSDFLACVSSYTTTGKAVVDAGITPTEIAPTVTTVRTGITNSTATQGTGLSAGSSGAISSLAYGGKQWLFLAARSQGVVAVDITDPTAASPTVKVYSGLVATNFGGREIGGVVPLLGADHPQLLVYAYGSKHVALINADTGAVEYEADLPLTATYPVGFSGGSAFIAGAIPDTGRDGVWLATADGYLFFDRATRTLGAKYTFDAPAQLAENLGGDIGHNMLFAANYAPGVQLVDLVAGKSYYFDGTPFDNAFPAMYEPDGGAVDTGYQVGIVTNEDSPDIALINLKTVVKTDAGTGRSTFVPGSGGAVGLSLGMPTISGSAVDSDTHLALFMAGYSEDVAVGRIQDPAAGGTWQGLSDWRFVLGLTGYSYARDPHAVAVVKNLSNLQAYGYLLDGGVHKAFQIDMAAFLASPAVGGTGTNAKQLTTDPTTNGIVKTIPW